MTDETSKSKVLLLDDDKFLLDMYAMKFSQQGFDVHACLSVKNALELLRGGFVPNVLLFAPDALRIALTNQSDEAEKRRAQELGADLFLIKATMIPSEVVNMVKEQLVTRNKR